MLAAAVVVLTATVAFGDDFRLSSGFDSSGNLITQNGGSDANWKVNTGVNGALLPALVVTQSGADWYSGWPANGPNSDWIAADPNSLSQAGSYSFYTTFSLTGYDPTTVSITGGSLATYYTGDLKLNGISILALGAGSYQSPSPFSLAPGFYAFLPGLNTLEVDVQGYFSEGMRLEGTLQATPSSSAPVALDFVPITPCRVVDTRATGPTSAPYITGGSTLTVNVPSSPCNIPSTAAAYSFNVTVVPHGPLSYLSVWPTGQAQPVVSTLNSDDGRVKANAAIVPAGQNGGVNFYATNDTDLVLDIDGYFVPSSSGTGLAFYPLPPCRVADTRSADGPLGGPYLSGTQSRELPVLQSSCALPSSAQAYSFNFTAIPRDGDGLSYLATWPSGQSQPLVSTLNAPTGTVTANAAIVPAGSNGDITVLATNDSDLAVDVNGYFAAAGPGALHFYPVSPCRVVDTRTQGSPFQGDHFVQVASVCGIPAAPAIVVNATVVPTQGLGFLTLWPYGSNQPLASTLNADDGFITSNMAIVPMAFGGIVAYASNNTQLVIDITGYFAP